MMIMISTDSRRRGFTFVELLLVIGLLAILSVFFLSNLLGGREKARDIKRKGDLRQIQKALELYKQCHNPPSYPAALPAVNSSWAQAGGDATATCPAGTVYMPVVPGDPFSSSVYSYTPSGLTYTLCTCLEAAADRDPSVVTGGSCGTTNCSSGIYKGKRYVISE